jgi:hypothetical protein
LLAPWRKFGTFARGDRVVADARAFACLGDFELDRSENAAA